MKDDFLKQLALDPREPKTWEPLMRHAAAEMADGILEVAAHDPEFAHRAISLYVYTAIKTSVEVIELLGKSMGEERALEVLQERNPSCMPAFDDFETVRDAIEEERSAVLAKMLKKITASPLVQ